MNCKIQVETGHNWYGMYVAYINNDKIIHRDLIKGYEAYPYPEPVVKEVVKAIFKYKSLGIEVEIDKEEDINNMCDLKRLLKALEF